MDHIPVSSSGAGGGDNSWPPALRRRLGLPSITSSKSSTESKSNSSNDDELSADINIQPTTTTQSSSTHTTSLTSHELRQYIHKTYSTLTSIQRQLHRGEESYFEQSYSHGNLLQGWDNIWIEQHHHNHNSNSYTNNSGGGGMYLSMGEDSSSNNVSNNNHAHHMNHNNNKSIPIRKMPAEYRWFTSSCGTNLPITSTDNNSNSSGGIGRVAALERWSLIDRLPTPEVQEKQVAKEEVVLDGSLMKKNDANMEVTNKQLEITSSNGKNSTVNTSSTMMDHPKNNIADDASSEKTGHTTIDDKEDTSQEQDSSTSILLPQSKRARIDIKQLSKDDGSTADDTTSSSTDMNTNLSKEHDDDRQKKKPIR